MKSHNSSEHNFKLSNRNSQNKYRVRMRVVLPLQQREYTDTKQQQKISAANIYIHMPTSKHSICVYASNAAVLHVLECNGTQNRRHTRTHSTNVH